MPAADKTPDGFSLRRWSRRKLDATRATAPTGTQSPHAPGAVPDAKVPAVASPGVPVSSGEPALPAIESLTIDSDFTAFLKPNVDESLKRRALKKLLTDPRFNVMDGLDTYIDDYTKSDTIPPEMLARLERARQKLLEQEQDKQEVPATQDEGPAQSASNDDDPAQDPKAL